MKYEEDLPRTEDESFVAKWTLGSVLAVVTFLLIAGIFIFAMYRGPHIDTNLAVKTYTERPGD